MVRRLLAIGVVMGVSIAGAAQPPGRSGPPLPLGPGIHSGNPWGPGMPFTPRPQPPGRGTTDAPPRPLILLPWVFPGYFPWSWGPGYGYPLVVPLGPLAVPAAEPPRREPAILLSGEAPARLTIQFPAAAEIWVDGRKQPGEPRTEHVLTSPVLQPPQTHTFEIHACWWVDGKTYEAQRTVTLGAGERSRLLVVSGRVVEK